MAKCISQLTFNKTLKNGERRLITVPCGKCYACRSNRRADWTFRIMEEARNHNSAFFLTFTYEDNKLPTTLDGKPTLVKSHLQNYMKNIRHLTKNKLKYYAVGEYGSETKRSHYHMILFGFPADIRYKLISEWKHGFVVIGEVNQATIHYVTKYMLKDTKEIHGREPPFSLCSQNLGASYLQNKRMHLQNSKTTVQLNGYEQRMPRYYKERIFSKLSLQELNEQETERMLQKEAKEENELRNRGVNPSKKMVQVHNQRIQRIIKKLKEEKL